MMLKVSRAARPLCTKMGNVMCAGLRVAGKGIEVCVWDATPLAMCRAACLTWLQCTEDYAEQKTT